ncbi:hypothetical protein IWZ01DRAFT_548167 [Phyllosticta capitalensis]
MQRRDNSPQRTAEGQPVTLSGMPVDNIRSARPASDTPQASAVSLKQQKVRLLGNIVKSLGRVHQWQEWLPASIVDTPSDIEGWTMIQLQRLEEIARFVKTPEGRRHLAELLQYVGDDGVHLSLRQDDLDRAHDKLSRKNAQIVLIDTHWGRNTRIWIGPAFKTFDRDPITWNFTVLKALAELAREAYSPGRRQRAMKLAKIIAEHDSDNSTPRTSRALELRAHHVDGARQRFLRLWPDHADRTLDGTLRHISESQIPDAIEDFGAYEQADPMSQATADKAVLNAYQNALNGRGAGFGTPDHGPTVCTRDFALTPGLGRYAVTIGPLWKGPDVFGEKRSYGNVARKLKDMKTLESHYGCTFAEYLDMKRLRPEEAFYFPHQLLRALVQLAEEFPHLPLQTVRDALVHQNVIANDEKVARGGRRYHNITPAIVHDTRAALRAEQEDEESGSDSDDSMFSLFNERVVERHDTPVDSEDSASK